MEVSLGAPEPILDTQPGASKFELSSDDQRVLIVYGENTSAAHARLFQFTNAQQAVVYRPHAGMSSAALSPDGAWVATACWKAPGVKVWDAPSGNLVTTLLPERIGTFTEFSPDSRCLIVIQQDDIFAWEVGSWKPLELQLDRKHGVMGDVDFHLAENLLVADNSRYVAQVVDWGSRRRIFDLESSVEDTHRNFSFSVGGGKLAVAGREYATVWDLASIRRRLHEMRLDW